MANRKELTTTKKIKAGLMPISSIDDIQRRIKPFGVRVNYYSVEEEYEDRTDSYDSTPDEIQDDYFNMKCTESWTSHYVGGISLSNSPYSDILLDWEPQVGKKYYLLYVIYSSGDSFNTYHSKYIEFIELFKTKEEALLAENIIREDEIKYKTNYDRTDLIIKDSSGYDRKIFASWLGYFERIAEINIDEFVLTEKV